MGALISCGRRTRKGATLHSSLLKTIVAVVAVVAVVDFVDIVSRLGNNQAGGLAVSLENACYACYGHV